MRWLGVARACRRARWRAGGAAALALTALWLVTSPPPRHHHRRRPAARLPLAPRRLAHLLADFSHLATLHPTLGEWTVLEESSNGSAWRYAVEYERGAHCSGRAHVLALDAAAAGGGGGAHRVLVAQRDCSTLGALPWLSLCDEWETEWVVRAAAEGGALLEERAAASCGWQRRLRRWLAARHRPHYGGADCGAELAAASEEHMRRLQALQ